MKRDFPYRVVVLWVAHCIHSGRRHFVYDYRVVDLFSCHRIAFVRPRDLNFDCGLDGSTVVFVDLLLEADEAVLEMLRSVVVVPWACRRD